MEWLFSLITPTHTRAMDRMLINVAVHMEVLLAQVFIQCHLYLALIPQLRRRATLCHPHNICHRMTNCSQRTGECLEEQEIKLFILRKTFFLEIIFTHDLYMHIYLQYCILN